METTENQEVEFDGTIEGAVASIIEPEEDLEAQDELLQRERDQKAEGQAEQGNGGRELARVDAGISHGPPIAPWRPASATIARRPPAMASR